MAPLNLARVGGCPAVTFLFSREQLYFIAVNFCANVLSWLANFSKRNGLYTKMDEMTASKREAKIS